MSNHPLNSLGQPYDALDLKNDLHRAVRMLREIANHIESVATHECPCGMMETHGPQIALNLRAEVRRIDLANIAAAALAPAEFAALMAGSRRAA